MRYRLRNKNGDYFCSTRDMMTYEWVPESTLQQRQWEGLLSYPSPESAEREIHMAQTPKTVKSGRTNWVRPDYPDMTGARVVSVR